MTSPLADIIDLHQVPYGNAQQNPDGSTSCQHGPVECKGNTLELCAIHFNPDWQDWFPFVYCLEKHGDNLIHFGQQCAESSNLNYTQIEDCYTGTMGVQLTAAAAKETNALQPPHQYTPWIVVAGKPVYTEINHFAVKVCEAYTGPKPEACKNPPVGQDDG